MKLVTVTWLWVLRCEVPLSGPPDTVSRMQGYVLPSSTSGGEVLIMLSCLTVYGHLSLVLSHTIKGTGKISVWLSGRTFT